jgi:hypothetical protein
MSSTDDITLKCMKGSPIFFKDVCAVFPPKMGEVVDIGYETFLQYLGILTSVKPNTDEKSDFAEVTKTLTNFQYFLLIANLDAEVSLRAHEAFRFFTHEDAIFSLDPPQIVVGPVEEKHIINEDNYDGFQHLIRRVCFMGIDEKEIIIEDSDDERVKALKRQFLKNRERVAKAKKKASPGKESDLQFSDLVGSVCIGDCNLNMENIWNITYYAFQDQLRRMGWRDQFNINNRAAIAGAKLKKSQLKHWIRAISNDDADK